MSSESERKVLEKLTAARHAVQRKYRQLKRGKLETSRLLDKTFVPITEPLQKLVKLQKESRGWRNIDNLVDVVKPENLMDYDYIPPPPPTMDQQSLDESLYNTADESQESTKKDNYEQLYDDSADRVFGIRKVKGSLKFGGSNVELSKDTLIDVSNQTQYPLTQGFLELLTKKEPDASLVTAGDKELYKKLILSTNPHRKGYQSNGQLKHTTNKKYINLIKPLLSPSGSGLPKYKVANNRSIDLVYWDDPNELVERLELLMAELRAGNSAHTNEIHSIIEELREAGYIL